MAMHFLNNKTIFISILLVKLLIIIIFGKEYFKSEDPTQKLSIQNCNKLFKETTDELSIYHPSITNKTIDLYKGKEILVDDILFGYDLLFENEHRFASGSWLGAQTQQDPTDAFLIQMILYKVKPDLIIDIGTNTGGSAIYFASIMNYYNQNGRILTIDPKNYTLNWYQGQENCKDCQSPDSNPLWKKYIKFYQGYSTDRLIIDSIKKESLNATSVFINHDGSHEAEVVFKDLKNYADLCTVGSYMVVQDTKLDRFRRVNPINKAIDGFIAEDSRFIIDRELELFFFYTQHPKGYLKRIK